MEFHRLPTGSFIASRDGYFLKFSNLRVERGKLFALVQPSVRFPSYRPLLPSDLNLMNPQSLGKYASYLEEDVDSGGAWKLLLREAAMRVVIGYYEPVDVEQLEETDVTSPDWIIQGLLLEKSPHVLYAPGGSGKSFLALFTLLCCENGIDFFGPTRQVRTAYLDWEVDKSEANRRITKLLRGMRELYGDGLRLPYYINMYAAFADRVDFLLDTFFEHGIELIVIDSAACALAGDFNNSEVVNRFFNEVRKVCVSGISVLVISHVSKAERQSGDGSRSPIGSVAFQDRPRIVWELRSEFDEELRRYRFGIMCRKSNVGKLSSFGVEMIFKDEAVFVQRINPFAISFSDTERSNKQIVLMCLSDGGKAVEDIARMTGIPKQAVWSALSKLKAEGKVKNAYRKWYLSTYEEKEEDGLEVVPF